MLYERRFDSLASVLEEAASMDADAGLRIQAKVAGKSCYAFVTRFGTHYMVMVYERRAGKPERLGKQVTADEVPDMKGLELTLSRLVPSRVRAYAY